MDKFDKIIDRIEREQCTRHGFLGKTKVAMKMILTYIAAHGPHVLNRDISEHLSIEIQRVQKLTSTLFKYGAITRKEMSNVPSKKKPIYGFTLNSKHPILKEG